MKKPGQTGVTAVKVWDQILEINTWEIKVYSTYVKA